jgi:MFS family permease
MMSLVVLAGALAQIPVGRASDRTDRRYVLSAASFGAALFAILMFIFAPRNTYTIIVLTAAYGALAYTLYSIAVAHANDHATQQDFVKVSGGLLLLYGFGTMIGPIVGALLMAQMRPESLFLATALPHLLLGVYALVRVRARAPVPIEDRDAFKTLPAERAVTPQAGHLDPRSDPDAQSDEDAEKPVPADA